MKSTLSTTKSNVSGFDVIEENNDQIVSTKDQLYTFTQKHVLSMKVRKVIFQVDSIHTRTHTRTHTHTHTHIYIYIYSRTRTQIKPRILPHLFMRLYLEQSHVWSYLVAMVTYHCSSIHSRRGSILSKNVIHHLDIYIQFSTGVY